ncbi:MAG: PEP-utilizing enzyme [Patescibacteria group bacterium]|nr:PEP-utilizing enzyme [Patescibacteria group bacterium]
MFNKNIKSKIEFGTKAETLKKLIPCVNKSVIDDLVIFSVREWKLKQEEIIKTIQKYFEGKIVVRSSALNEDCLIKSNAGHFTSVLDVDSKDRINIIEAVEKVIFSYGDNDENNQFFIQTFLEDVDISGVIFTRDINTFAPYITINYDDKTGLTDTVTSGKGINTKTFVIFRKKLFNREKDKFNVLYEAILELEKLFENDALDIEFVYKENKVHLLQVRPIVFSSDVKKNIDIDLISGTLDHIYNKIKELNLPHPDLYGDNTVYGVMPDWNPAEMIGIKPRPLSLSLYRELITDNVWAFQRDNYGYKRLRSFPLLVSFAGHPYIDVRVDFNSWIPKKLDDKLSHKLANFYINKLKNNPGSHDKIEFDIVYTCYTFDLENNLQELLENGFGVDEVHKIKESLLYITQDIIGSNGKEGLYKEDLKKIDILEKRRKSLLNSSLSNVNKLYWLVEDCKRYGTLPFAGIARAGFVAILFLDSLVKLEVISVDQRKLFMSSLNTVTKELSNDVKFLKNGKIDRENFLKKYGHLRPGTYDIMLESYSENFEKYFDSSVSNMEGILSKSIPEYFKLSKEQNVKLNNLLQEHNLNISVTDFFSFIKEAIEGREYAKFAFSKSVSEILSLIKKYGKNYNFSSGEMSFVEISTIMKFYSTVAYFNESELLSKEIERNKSFFNFYKYLKLPYLINKPEDVFSFYLDGIEPNYITTNVVEGEITLIDSSTKIEDISGKIVFIENADPGFDWIFSHNIKGLVTMYGGANSHMSIRSAELNIPAVIGCGSVLFEQWNKVKLLNIDCASKRVVVIS